MQTMMKRIQQLRSLSLQEWWWLFTAMLLLPFVALVLWMIGFKRTKIFISRFFIGEVNLVVPDKVEMEIARDISRMVSVAARHGFYRGNCLKQSIVVWWLLARRGIDSDLCIGIELGSESENEFSAHAWVECDGINLTDPGGVQKKYLAFDKTDIEKIIWTPH